MRWLENTLKHLFVPHPRNNHRPRLRQHSGLLGMIALILLFQVWLQVFAIVKPSVLGYSSNITPESILVYTNQARSRLGVPDLRLDSQLSEAARKKAYDMFERNYWAHITPTGEQPWSFITSTGYTYLYAGENLARDFGDPEAVVDAWMASPSHRENLVNSNYDDIGIAVESGDLNGVQTTLVVQMFGSRRVATSTSQLAGTSTTSSDSSEVAEKQVEASPTPVAATPTEMLKAVGKTAELAGLDRDQAGVKPLNQEVVNSGFKVNPLQVSKAIGLAVVVLLAVALIIDEAVMWQKKLGRVAGRSWAHLVFLMMTLGLLWLTQSGVIL